MFDPTALGATWWENAKTFGGNQTMTADQEAKGLQFWTNQAQALQVQILATQVIPTALVAPSGGGPVSGTGTLE